MGKYVKKILTFVLVTFFIFSNNLPAFAVQPKENIILGNSSTTLNTKDAENLSHFSGEEMILIDEEFEANTMGE